MRFHTLENGIRVTKEKATPDFSLNCEILCIGAGASGCYAAIAAAREGADVIAVEKDENIGGMPINGQVLGYYYGESGGSYRMIDFLASSFDKLFYGGGKRIEAKQACIYNAMIENGVNLITGSVILGLYIEGSRVFGAKALTPHGILDISCKMLIDATSDGHIVRMCPVRTMFGRSTDGKTVPFTNRVDLLAKGKYTQYNDDDGICDQYAPVSYTEKIMYAHAKKLTLKTTDSDNRVISIAPMAGVREGIRYEGEDTLTYSDIITANSPEKVLFYARSDIDKHGSDTAIDEELYQNWWVISNLSTVTARIPVPLGAVVPKGLDGIVTAGRCLSIDSYASSAVRMNRDMHRMGECIGIAAAQAVRENCRFTEINMEKYYSTTAEYNCRIGNLHDTFAFDSPNGTAPYRAVSFDLTDERIIELLSTDSPGEAIWACYASDGHITEKLIPLLSPDNSAALRRHAAFALGIMGKREALPVLRETISERCTEFLHGCRRSNQLEGTVAICLLGRLGDPTDIELLLPILSAEEHDRPLYRLPVDPLVNKSSHGYTYFQFYTHALMAIIKLARIHSVTQEISERLLPLLTPEKRNATVDTITNSDRNSPIAELLYGVIEKAISELES